MADQKQLEIIKQGVDSWNAWHLKNRDIPIDLVCADLSETNLRGIILEQADLRGAFLLKANLSGANLKHAQLESSDFRHADLRGTDLQGSTLQRSYLRGANLWGASLYKADLSHADLGETDLRKAVLKDAIVIRANLMDANLNSANLENADLSEADLQGVDLAYARLCSAKLKKANLRNARLVQTNLENADLTDCFIYGISVWDVKLEGAKQSDLVITNFNEPTITTDDLEIAQFMYLLLNHKKLRNVINSIVQRGVLILGRFGDGGLEILQTIAAKLRELQYLPIIFDFDRPAGRDYTETVMTLVGLSRFVIVDLSGPSVPQELYATVPHFSVPFVPIIQTSKKPHFSMYSDLYKYSWVIGPPVEFDTKENLIDFMPSKIIAAAEKQYEERQVLLDQIFKR